MKKTLAIILALCFALCLFGCGSNSGSNSTPVPAETSAAPAVTQPESEPAPVVAEPLEGYDNVVVVNMLDTDVPISYTLDEEAKTWKLAYHFNGNDVVADGTYGDEPNYEIINSNNDFLTLTLEGLFFPAVLGWEEQ